MIAKTQRAEALSKDATGYRAQVEQSNSLVLGSISGVNGATASTNVGIGTTAPKTTLEVTGATFLSARRARASS